MLCCLLVSLLSRDPSVYVSSRSFPPYLHWKRFRASFSPMVIVALDLAIHEIEKLLKQPLAGAGRRVDAIAVTDHFRPCHISRYCRWRVRAVGHRPARTMLASHAFRAFSGRTSNHPLKDLSLIKNGQLVGGCNFSHHVCSTLENCLILLLRKPGFNLDPPSTCRPVVSRKGQYKWNVHCSLNRTNHLSEVGAILCSPLLQAHLRKLLVVARNIPGGGGQYDNNRRIWRGTIDKALDRFEDQPPGRHAGQDAL
mmetsp:Transcript_14504/g.39432  ORF Transcript_14504/g.39432 Transcript_14504/m.39432 type:complete len:253 (+) Transcript_14504:228-986(+)